MAEHDGYKSRKFWFCTAIAVLLTNLLVMGYINQEGFESLLTMDIIALIGGNVGEKWVNK